MVKTTIEGVFVSFTVILINFLLLSCAGKAPQMVPKEKMGEVTFKVNIDSFEGAKKVRLWLPYPVPNDYQKITDLKVDGNFTKRSFYQEDKFGNSILYVEWHEPKSQPEMTYSFKVKRYEIIKKDFSQKEDGAIPSEVKKFLLPSRLVPIDESIKGIAEEITKGKSTILVKAEAIYNYIIENYRRDLDIKGCGIGDVLNLLKTKAGKCVDIHSVYVALARSVGIPSKEIFGIRMSSDKGNDITGSYHCRAEFYLSGYGWVPVDASDVLKKMLKENLGPDDPKLKETRSYFFGNQTETFIDFGSGRDLVLNPPQKGGKLNYFMYPYAEVDGRALDYLSQKELKYTITYIEIKKRER